MILELVKPNLDRWFIYNLAYLCAEGYIEIKDEETLLSLWNRYNELFILMNEE